MGGSSLAIYSQGGASGEMFSDLLREEGVIVDPVMGTNSTRENFILVEEDTNNQFRFGLPGDTLSDSEINQFLSKIESLEGCEYLIASGSLPDGVPTNIYGRIGEIAKAKGIKYIVDSSKDALQESFYHGVLLAKPNIAELRELTNKKLESIEEQEAAAKELILDGKVDILVVSLGPAGAFVVTKDLSFNVHAPAVKKKSTVGAGDCMVAGIVYQLSSGASIQDAAMFGVACGSAATLNEGANLFTKDDVYRLYDYIRSKHKHLN